MLHSWPAHRSGRARRAASAARFGPQDALRGLPIAFTGTAPVMTGRRWHGPALTPAMSWLGSSRPSCGLTATLPTSWPGLSRPSRCGEARRLSYRDHRDEPGDDVAGCVRRCEHPPTSWPGLSRPSRSEGRGTSQKRDHRHEAGDDAEKVVRSGADTRHVMAGLVPAIPIARCSHPEGAHRSGPERGPLASARCAPPLGEQCRDSPGGSMSLRLGNSSYAISQDAREVSLRK